MAFISIASVENFDLKLAFKARLIIDIFSAKKNW